MSRITGTLHVDLCIFIYRSVLRRRRNVAKLQRK